MELLKDNIFTAAEAEAEQDINTGRTRALTRRSYVIGGEKTALIGGAVKSVPNEVIKSASCAVFCGARGAQSIKRILEINPEIEIVASVAAIRNLRQTANSDFKARIAKYGSSLDLGCRTLRFIITPHLNWPDTMTVYDEAAEALFTGFAFGAYDGGDTREYYKNELSRFAPFVHAAAEELAKLNVKMLCPQTGPVITENVRDVIAEYASLSAPRSDAGKTMAVFYASSDGNTELMAAAVKRAAEESGVSVSCFDAANTAADRLICALHGADMLAFGTPTVHRNAVKPIWDLISSADLVNMKRRPCMVFGSYGWGGDGIHLLHNHLKLLGLKVFEKPFGCLFTPSDADMAELEKYTGRFTQSAF